MKHVTGDQKFAVLLCGLSGDSRVERKPREFFEELFVNDSVDGLNRYWREASHGTISLTGSQVFGWRDLQESVAEFNALGKRAVRVGHAAERFAQPGPDQVDFRSFTGIIVVTDQGADLGGVRSDVTFNLNGENRPYRALICSQGNTHSAIAHEMGHTFGLDHSFDEKPKSCDPADDGRPGAYCDGWDIMSAQLVNSIPRPRFGPSGPLLNALNMNLIGWLDASRVSRFTGNSDSMQLRPLSRPDLPGPLAIWLDDLLIEFRMNTGWDEGFGRPGVLIHKVDDQYPPQVPDDQHSVLVGFRSTPSVSTPTSLYPASGPGVEFLQKGDKYVQGNPLFGPYLEIQVLDINPANESATVGFFRKHGVPEQLGILQWIVTELIGVSPQGGIVKVPPRPPLYDILVGLAVNELAETLHDRENQAMLRQESMNLIIETAKKELKSLHE